jgi:hypothetical protein
MMEGKREGGRGRCSETERVEIDGGDPGFHL